MNACIPDPYPDEVFYSILARLSDNLGYSSQRRLIENVFGNKNVVATLEFPSHISNFLNTLPPDSYFTEESTINNHTQFPYYAAFLPIERARLLKQDMLGKNGPSTHFRSGIMASRVFSPHSLQFCPQCVKEERHSYGECYWHRLHQLPGVIVCPNHNTMLIKSGTAIRNKESRLVYISAEKSINSFNEPFVDLVCADEGLLNIAINSEWLLNYKMSTKTLDSLKAKYQHILYESGYCNYSGRFDNFNKLIIDFTNNFGKDLLGLFGCSIDPLIKDNWLFRLVHSSNSVQHPLRHLLFIQFLGLSVKEFSEYSIPNPFGNPPWPCLNPVCQYYREPVIRAISTYRSKYTNGRPVGVFSCECGFAYKRTGPDTCLDDRFRVDKIASFGPHWQEKLSALWMNSGLSLREIARILSVDPITVKRQAQKILLPDRRNAKLDKDLYSTRNSDYFEIQCKTRTSKTDSFRSEWVRMMEENFGVGVKVLRAKQPNIYMWLYKNDYKWLSQHLPPTQRKVSIPKRIDWEERDKSLSCQIEFSAQSIRLKQGKPIQVTISAIGREMGKLALLQKHIDKLPITNEVLSRLVESIADFAIRRINWIASLYIQERNNPQRWQFVRRAGVARQLGIPAIDKAIDYALEQIYTDLKTREI